MAKPPRELVDAIVESLEKRPEEWRIDGIWAETMTGSPLIYIGGGRQLLVIRLRGYKFGGPAFFGFLVPWRIRLWTAVKRAQKAKANPTVKVDPPDWLIAETIANLRGAA